MRKKIDWKGIVERSFRCRGGECYSVLDLRKLLRKEMLDTVGRQGTSKEMDNLLLKLKNLNIIVEVQKVPFKIGEWSKKTLTMMFEIHLENLDKFEQTVTTTAVVEDSTPSGIIEFWVRFNTAFKELIGDEAKRILEFPSQGFIVVNFVVEMKPENIKKLFGIFKSISEKNIEFSFDNKTDPRVIEIIEKVTGL